VTLEPDMSRLWGMKNISRLTLAHNKITDLPPALATLENLEILNLFNNCLEELPGSLSGMPKLRSAHHYCVGTGTAV
jgi:Leucine-rich repeat (LRR) protein